MGDLDGDGDDDAIILNHYDHQVYWISFENGEPSINSELISTSLSHNSGQHMISMVTVLRSCL